MVLFHLIRIISLLYLHNLFFLFLSLHLYLVCVIIIIIIIIIYNNMQGRVENNRAGQGLRYLRTRTLTPLIDGLGRATWSLTMASYSISNAVVLAKSLV